MSKNNFAITFATDRNYLPYAIFAIRRLRKLSNLTNTDIFLFSADLSENDYNFVDEGIIFRPINLTEVQSFSNSHVLPIITYSRILIPALIPDQYSKILYLDVDTYLQNSNIEEVFGTDMEGHAVAATVDQMNWRWGKRRRLASYLETLGVVAKDYLNAGVFLIDTNAYREQNLMNNILNFAQKNSDKLMLQDQSAINGYLNGRWKRLPIRWNFQVDALPPSVLSYSHANILHFNGSKPWQDRVDYWTTDYADTYREFMIKNFPNHQISTSTSVKPYARTKKLTYLLKARSIRTTIRSIGI